jgi:hypothetical protein
VTRVRKVHIKEFTAVLDKQKTAMPRAIKRLVQGIILEVCEGVIVGNEFSPGTPVDTGYARASWWLSIDGKGQAPALPDIDQSSRGKDKIAVIDFDAAALAEIASIVPGQEVRLNNNAEHILPLERGHSKQAPVGMVAVAANALPAIVAKVKKQQGWK